MILMKMFPQKVGDARSSVNKDVPPDLFLLGKYVSKISYLKWFVSHVFRLLRNAVKMLYFKTHSVTICNLSLIYNPLSFCHPT